MKGQQKAVNQSIKHELTRIENSRIDETAEEDEEGSSSDNIDLSFGEDLEIDFKPE